MNKNNYFKKAKEIFDNISLIKHLNMDISLVEVEENYAVMEVLTSEKHGNYMGTLHGGLLSALVDTIAFFPGKLLPSGEKLATSNFFINFYRPANLGEIILAKAEILYMGKRKVNIEVNVFNKLTSKLVAKAIVDLMRLE